MHKIPGAYALTKKPVKVMQWGLGAMGSGMADLILKKKGMKLVAAYKKRPEGQGKDLCKVLNLTKKTGIIVGNDPIKEIRKHKPDVVIMAVCSGVKEGFDDIMSVIEEKVNLITIAEEMAYPWAYDEKLAAKLDKAALKNGVTVLGTGINPGFVLDSLVIMLSGACRRVDSIEASRINDLSPFGPTVMKSQGVGTTKKEFDSGIKDGSIVGHIGFPASICMIADAMGIELDEIKESREPIMSKTERKTKYVHVKPGMVAGCKHIGYGIRKGKKVITLIHPQQVLPEKEGIKTGDYIKINGDPNVNVANSPEYPGGIGTMAVTVNCIPFIGNARKGLISMLDMPVLRIAK
ncbi:MAG: 2,4-diaminopentanoate dehydrogenase [Candidatus Wallbacteria bacterium]|nr:2,4-diaminopentanoate dehydrogenase [Candidatus Wallbacteria bacterium]